MKTNKLKAEKAFNNWSQNSIHLTFPNGNSISTIWGAMTYSDNYNVFHSGSLNTFMDSDTVEIMILKAPKKLVEKIQKKYDFEGDTVKGYLTITEWLGILNLFAI